MKTQPNSTRKPVKLYVGSYKLIELTTSDPSYPTFKIYHRADPRPYLGRIQLTQIFLDTFLKNPTAELKDILLSKVDPKP